METPDILKEGPGKPGYLELEVPVININKGHNEEMIRRSAYLSGYDERGIHGGTLDCVT
ncbi:MAG: hypothetical protein FWF88_05000 [Peptococcaceae bacterium]|jgi:hypothetical protein|nr:hypothetical protein [Peptococcaceae bacterium]MDR2736946.1 hypothetical protein [Gracilibacteraceae bacterium]